MEAPPFRVLSPGGRIFYDPPQQPRPPPSRAPEPYKITPLSTSYGRSHRNTSFAIIAEPRPSSPSECSAVIAVGTNNNSNNNINGNNINSNNMSAPSRPDSGRVSPFRGRGFKGPPPRARSRSRPRSPDSRRGSNTNENSPKRSQIPRPAAATRANNNNKENGFVPRYGRRAANDNYSSSVIANNNKNSANNRVRPAAQQKAATELSPIRGSPSNKQAAGKDTKSGVVVKANGSIPRSGFDRSGHLAPPRAQPGGKRFITATSSTLTTTTTTTKTSQRNGNNNNNNSNGNGRILDSPSRIPRRQGGDSITGSTTNLLAPEPAGRAGNNGGDGDGKSKLGKKKSSSSRDNLAQQQNFQGGADDVGVNGGGVGSESGLADLLRQSSGATVTSSVVNTTTTTVVQPLHIDAASILAENELAAKLANLEKQQRSNGGGGNSEPEAGRTSTNGTSVQSGGDKGGANSAAARGDTPASETSRQNAPTIAEESEGAAGASSSSMSSHKKTDSKSSIATASTSESKKLSPTSSVGLNKSDADLTAMDNKNRSAKRTTHETIAAESDSLGSLHSTDTGVSVNTVKGVSSAKEKTGLHVVKRTDEIETLSGNIVHLENNGERTPAAASGPASGPAGVSKPAKGRTGGATVQKGARKKGQQKQTAANRWKRLRFGNKFISKGKKPARGKGVKKFFNINSSNCWPKMRCLALKREPKGQPWPGKRNQTASTLQLTLDSPDNVKQIGGSGAGGSSSCTGIKATPGRWARIKEACRCAKLRARTRLGRGIGGRRGGGVVQAAQVAPADMTPIRTGCCPGGADRRIGGLCRGIFSHLAGCCGKITSSKCCSCSCCALPSCCKRSEKPSKQRGAKQSVGSIAPPPVSEEARPKLPDVLIEHNSVMRGAIPCLPVPLAWFCLIFNVLLPGTGTTLSGLFNLCCGQPRFSATASPKARFGALVVDIIVGVSQLFTVLFCLVGWGWSIWWGVTMLRVAKKYKRFKESEAAANDPERAEGGILPAPGVSMGAPTGAT